MRIIVNSLGLIVALCCVCRVVGDSRDLMVPRYGSCGILDIGIGIVNIHFVSGRQRAQLKKREHWKGEVTNTTQTGVPVAQQLQEYYKSGLRKAAVKAHLTS